MTKFGKFRTIIDSTIEVIEVSRRAENHRLDLAFRSEHPHVPSIRVMPFHLVVFYRDHLLAFSIHQSALP